LSVYKIEPKILTPIKIMEIEQFCDDIKSEDSRGRQIYMMLSKTELGLFNMIDGTQRVIYKGPKSVAAFKQMKNGNLIVT